MSAHEDSPDPETASHGSRVNGTAAAERRAAGADATGARTDAGTDAPAVPPAPLVEKTRAARRALRGAVARTGRLRTALRARGDVTAGVAACYAAGRPAGPRRRGPLSRLTGGRL